MFSNVVVGVKELEAGRDALRLARLLTSAKGNLTFAHVEVVAPKPAPDSGAVGAASRRRDALERLAPLRDEAQPHADVVYSEARSVRRGLHDAARARDADLLIISASGQDETYRVLVGDAAREVLGNPPRAVALAPIGYSDQRGPLRAIGVAYDRSPESARALHEAWKLAAGCHAKLAVFHVVTGVQAHDPARFDDGLDDEARQVREGIARLEGIEVHAEYGDPAHKLRRAGASVDLLVLGSRKHGPVGRCSDMGRRRDWPTSHHARCL